MKSECVTSDQLYESVFTYEPNNKFWWASKSPKCGPKIFFEYCYHLNLVDIIVVYHNMQNELRLICKSLENEFGDKNDLEISLNWA